MSAIKTLDLMVVRWKAFLNAAAQVAAGGKRTSAMIWFDTALLARVDRAAKRRGVSRSAWVAFTLSKALDDDE